MIKLFQEVIKIISYIIYNNLDLILIIPLIIGLVISIYMGIKEKKDTLNHDLIHNRTTNSNNDNNNKKA